jgi:serine protease Do
MILAGVVALGMAAGSLVTANTGGRTMPVYVSADAAQAPARLSFEDGFEPVVSRAVPAVVSVFTSKVVRTQASQSPFSDPFFQQFFGGQFNVPRKRLEQSLGSGVIISPAGYIITNNHVIDGASDIKVTLNDRRELPAKLIGTDSKTDIAILHVDAKDLPVLPFGDSGKMRPGNFVLAIGNPFGLSHTVTMGIVSATGRGGLDIEDYEDFIQTDAAINPGNSGGALINARGELIGINTAILASDSGGGGEGGNEGIGFAIPINMARQVMDQIMTNGKVVRGYLGAWIQDVTPAMAHAFGLTDAAGALVGDVSPDGPAAKAGLKRGDIITAIDGKAVTDARQLRLDTAMTKPGATVRLKLVRSGKEMVLPVTLGEMPSTPNQQPSGQTGESGALQGLRVDNMSPDIARELHLPPDTQGVVVTRVGETSAARQAGLRRGDVIQEVDHKPVADVAAFQRAVEAAGKEPLLLLVNRGGNTMYVVVESH